MIGTEKAELGLEACLLAFNIPDRPRFVATDQ